MQSDLTPIQVIRDLLCPSQYLQRDNEDRRFIDYCQTRLPQAVAEGSENEALTIFKKLETLGLVSLTLRTALLRLSFQSSISFRLIGELVSGDGFQNLSCFALTLSIEMERMEILRELSMCYAHYLQDCKFTCGERLREWFSRLVIENSTQKLAFRGPWLLSICSNRHTLELAIKYHATPTFALLSDILLSMTDESKHNLEFALEKAIEYGKITIVRWLIEDQHVDSIQQAEGYLPLTLAITRNQTEIFYYLLASTPQILITKIGRAVQQECRDRSRMPSSA
eukprot:TRINITY_DN55310_c0_g1_i3.p1 TRINITY_DN55310_c0_g1~~TRINITY_DN55310_c0_g1_i3.p1  ORF type:complete len:282 (+),score=5.02 TRINITY_DN55310_c0_g1_i3:173-1018(+)